jgi:hypothetical protein
MERFYQNSLNYDNDASRKASLGNSLADTPLRNQLRMRGRPSLSTETSFKVLIRVRPPIPRELDGT